MSKSHVAVRMYRRLLGDCFLLTIGDPKAKRADRTHILIDCGILQQVPGEANLIKEVAADICRTVENRLDLLIITHEHWDHISGFSHARETLIDKMQIDHLWLAWTERRGDPQADIYRSKSQKAKEVVARGAKLSSDGSITAGIENFNGTEAKPGKLRGTEIIPALIDRTLKTGQISYLEPGQVIDTPGPRSLRANVLGPPRNPNRLMKDLPSAGDAKETYVASVFAAEVAGRYAIANEISAALDSMGTGPFALPFRISPKTVRPAKRDNEMLWLKEHYFDSQNDWRRIDDDWKAAIGALALKLDSDTNNTSLVLAFEIEPGGDVLLFAADAQVGNWLSWHDQSYPAIPIENNPTSTASDLLGRTVLYKVGHHASHNATLDALGVALMNHRNLIAMIPVDENEARREKNGKQVHRGWDMPYSHLLQQLLTKTHNRVVRGDAEVGKDPSGKILNDSPQFLDRILTNNLFHEISF